MLKISVRNVLPGQLENLRRWFAELETTRRAEAIETLIDETVTQETVLLIDGERPMVIYAMEVEDYAHARRSADSDRFPINAEHHAVLSAALGDPVEAEIILNLTAGR